MAAATNHPVAMRLWRSVNSRLVGLHQYFHLIFGTATYQPVPPSDQVLRTAAVLFELLEIRRRTNPASGSDDGDLWEKVEESELWDKVKALLHDCPEVDSLGQVVDNEGYSVLLRAVLQSDTEVLQLLIDEGCNLNCSKCTLPLHLACKRGSLDMVRFLLHNGAAADLETGMCYPHPHAPVVHVPSRFHFLETDIFECDSNHRLPLMYALEGDHLEVVQFLLEENCRLSSGWPYQRHPLHHACAHGAYHCVQYLASQKSADISCPDEDGLAPLLHAVQWGLPLVKLLVEAGANVHSTDYKKQTALHLLFKNIRDPHELHATTKFLLGTGMEDDVSRLDHQGNSPLHVLVAQLNRLVTSFSTPTASEAQTDFDQQVLDTLESLLKFNADANLVNLSGVTPLHRMLLMLDLVLSNDPSGLTLETLPGREEYKVDFDLVHCAMEILLHHGADPDRVTAAGRTALLILLQMALNMDPSRLASHQCGLLECLRLVLEAGARPSRTLANHINVVTFLSKLGHKCLCLRDHHPQRAMADFLQAAMALLLKHGLESNHCSRRKTPQLEGASGNVLLEMVKLARLARQPDDLELVHGWVLTLLQGGANPDIEPYPSDPIICQSQSSIFLQPKGTQAVNHYMCDLADFRSLLDTPQAERLLLLFYHSMDHEALYQCMNTAKFLSRFDPNRAPSGHFLNLITDLSTQPRSLAQIARVTIYKSLNRQLDPKVRQLPLPTATKQYLLNVE